MVSPKSPVDNCLFINEELGKAGILGSPRRDLHPNQKVPWQISPRPFPLDQRTAKELAGLGHHLLLFLRACQQLYRESLRGRQPKWVAAYLHQGKPEAIIEYGQMRRFRSDLPLIIRPDIILAEGGLVASELDSVPGGFGTLAALSQVYASLGFQLIGGSRGIIEGFSEALRQHVSQDNPTLAIVVSEESQDYWDEMAWLGRALDESGLRTHVLRPEEICFREDGLFTSSGEGIDILYRFFELFDLKNIPKIDLILYAIKKKKVVATPPLKSYLEEKLLFALFHHPLLASFWLNSLGKETYELLQGLFPRTWILDPRSLPPYGVIPNLRLGDQLVGDWQQLKAATQKQRQFVIKPSGFSELAWGGRGVSIGHDLSQDQWGEALDQALASFERTPYILQEFVKGARVTMEYYDFAAGTIKRMDGRVRLCPYYFVQGEEAPLGGILATVCPSDKKIIHGMVDGIMAPTAV
ncbi:MAG: hypothetical protein GX182_02550 [Firmicutes bacterium]|nr:hypothetical protein [Bacillota bacterium]